MAPTQKLINDGNAAVDEMLTGILAAHPNHLWRPGHAPRAVISKHGPRPGKVALVIGGGSGHEPTFLGFVGKGLADAAAIGNVFASPPPQPAVDAALASHGGAGVLFMYGNYAGDVMNFDMACEVLEMEGVEARTVLTTDDIASAPVDQKQKRRGVAGNGIGGRHRPCRLDAGPALAAGRPAGSGDRGRMAACARSRRVLGACGTALFFRAEVTRRFISFRTKRRSCTE